MNYEILFKTIPAAFFISNFTPLQDWLKKRIYPRLKNNHIKELLGCWKCMSFWITLISSYLMTYNLLDSFILASLASLIVWTYMKIMDSLKIYL